MIYTDYIREWQRYAPWPLLTQVEQDLIISRALIELYKHPQIANTLAFRGGTALYKLYTKLPARYSEDLDFVQITAEPIGKTFNAIREALDPWLGKPKWKKKYGRVTLYYSFIPEEQEFPMKLKLEINIAEHFSVYGFIKVPYKVDSRWISGEANICTYQLDELMATKLRALYQRKKGRDLFDLWLFLKQDSLDCERVINAFNIYLKHEDSKITRALFEKNLFEKLSDKTFMTDIVPLLNKDVDWDAEATINLVHDKLISQLPGEPWKGNNKKDD